jgi:uncharacterized protein YqeY
VLRERFNQALKEAMKARDQRRTATLRLVNSALKERDIAARGEGRPPLTDEEILALLQKLTKQRQESMEIYEKAGRSDLAEQEREEIAIIASFMPRPMGEEEMRAAVEAAIGELSASSIKDMGRVMAALKERHAGSMDFTRASLLVKERLVRGATSG